MDLSVVKLKNSLTHSVSRMNVIEAVSHPDCKVFKRTDSPTKAEDDAQKAVVEISIR